MLWFGVLKLRVVGGIENRVGSGKVSLCGVSTAKRPTCFEHVCGFKGGVCLGVSRRPWGSITEEIVVRARKPGKYRGFCNHTTEPHYSEHVVFARTYGLEVRAHADAAKSGFWLH